MDFEIYQTELNTLVQSAIKVLLSPAISFVYWM